jgi:hypothetical protein
LSANCPPSHGHCEERTALHIKSNLCSPCRSHKYFAALPTFATSSREKKAEYRNVEAIVVDLVFVDFVSGTANLLGESHRRPSDNIKCKRRIQDELTESKISTIQQLPLKTIVQDGWINSERPTDRESRRRAPRGEEQRDPRKSWPRTTFYSDSIVACKYLQYQSASYNSRRTHERVLLLEEEYSMSPNESVLEE